MLGEKGTHVDYSGFGRLGLAGPRLVCGSFHFGASSSSGVAASAGYRRFLRRRGEGKGGQVQLRFLPSSFLPGKEDEAREEKEEGGGRGILPSVAFQSNGGWTEEGLQWWRGGVKWLSDWRSVAGGGEKGKKRRRRRRTDLPFRFFHLSSFAGCWFFFPLYCSATVIRFWLLCLLGLAALLGVCVCVCVLASAARIRGGGEKMRLLVGSDELGNEMRFRLLLLPPKTKRGKKKNPTIRFSSFSSLA